MAINAQGMILQIENDTPGTHTNIGEVTAITGPSLSYTVLNVTNLNDTLMRKAPGLLDAGEVSADLHLNYGDAGQDRVRAQFGAKARSQFRITIPAGTLGGGATSIPTVLRFYGHITRWQISGRMDSVMSAGITITLDSDITET